MLLLTVDVPAGLKITAVGPLLLAEHPHPAACVERLREDAAELGYNAIIGLRLGTTPQQTSVSYGTAVRVQTDVSDELFVLDGGFQQDMLPGVD